MFVLVRAPPRRRSTVLRFLVMTCRDPARRRRRSAQMPAGDRPGTDDLPALAPHRERHPHRHAAAGLGGPRAGVGRTGARRLLLRAGARRLALGCSRRYRHAAPRHLRAGHHHDVPRHRRLPGRHRLRRPGRSGVAALHRRAHQPAPGGWHRLRARPHLRPAPARPVRHGGGAATPALVPAALPARRVGGRRRSPPARPARRADLVVTDGAVV